MSSAEEAGAPAFSLRQLGYFVAVAEAGTFAGAAARLHVSASALSLALDELERALGAQLTVRRRAHGVRLTATGTDTLRRARRLLRDAGELAAATDEAGGEVAGSLLLGCFPTLAPGALPGLLTRFGAAHPRARVRFVEDAQDVLTRRLLDGELDLALLYDHDLDAGLEPVVLSSNTPYLLLPGGHRLVGREAVHLHEVADEPMVLFDLRPASDHLMTVCRAAGVTPRIAHRTATVELTRSLVGAGLGYTVLAQGTPGPRTAAGGRVARVELADHPAPLDIVLVRPRAVDPSATARAFARIATGPRAAQPA